LWIVSERRAEIYKVAYDEAFKQLSPGTALTAKLMQHVIDIDGVDEVDYLIGDDPYKKSWMGARRERWGIEAIRPAHPIGWMLRARQWAAQTYKRRLAQRDALAADSSGKS
jgi:CelD/BcsL family acetyltransferase involved in cellulose biosynthesis